jgi:hypothetical protein
MNGVYIEPEHVDAETGAAVLGISERSFHELVKDGDITPIKVPGMRRTVFELRQIRALAAKWRAKSLVDNVAHPVELRRRA